MEIWEVHFIHDVDSIEGVEEVKQKTRYLMETTNYMEDYKNEAVWREWLTTRTMYEHQGLPYSWFQTAYHYSKNQLYLEGEVNRYKNGTFKLDYDWVDDFNKDSANYRKNEF